MANSVRGEQLRGAQENIGIRIFVDATLSAARVSLQFDIGFGDLVTPEPIETEMPVLLDYPAPFLRIYPKETFIAEKFEAMVKLGMANTHMKDFFDIWILSRNSSFEI